MSGEKRLEPVMLESEMMKFIEAAKAKMLLLAEEIGNLKLENEQLQRIVLKTEEEIKDNEAALVESAERVKNEEENQEVLIRMRKEKEQELYNKKGQLNAELDEAEKNSQEAKAKAKRIAENKKLLKAEKSAKSKANNKMIAGLSKNIETLNELIIIKDNELSLIHICRCRRLLTCRSRWSP
eukprot:TRINITY_DN7886_c0_g1_i14.p1 TRINITY_DN7886_c0_g1~~TRINITY_DN7886_c0_g1_i14.p1  ORF type:complete len:182 (-),score=85.53 TRINITY_DN7886_c0_g1_i14:24-569(-)